MAITSGIMREDTWMMAISLVNRLGQQRPEIALSQCVSAVCSYGLEPSGAMTSWRIQSLWLTFSGDLCRTASRSAMV